MSNKLAFSIIGFLSAALIASVSYNLGFQKGHQVRYSNPPTQEEVERTVEIIETYNSMFQNTSEQKESTNKNHNEEISL